MNKEEVIKLTTGVYKLTRLFPQKEPLRYKIRELADEILKDLIFLDAFNNDNFANKFFRNKDKFESILSNFEVLDSYFEICGHQSWVSLQNLLSFQQEYSKIKDNLNTLKENISVTVLDESGPGIEKSRGNVSAISERQKKIIGILNQKEKAQVGELKKVFPSVTKRTLRRDFVQLLRQGLIERVGERNETFYRLKSSSNL